MVVTELGMVTMLSIKQPPNALLPMVVTELPIVKLLRLVQ